jgi:hypothetical protein
VSEGRLREELSVAEHAQRLLDDPLLRATLDGWEQSLLSEWADCADPGRRNDIWQEHRAVRRFRGKLAERVATGKMAAQQLAELN